MLQPAETTMTVDEYLAFERSAETRHELIDGVLVAMSGGTRAHNRITGNIFATLHSQTRHHGRRPYIADMRLRVANTGLFTYPDIVVTCGDEAVEDDGMLLTDATLIVEVLSKSTEAYDRGEKWARYRRLPSLTDYLLVAQDQIRIERFSRAEGETWVFSEASTLDAVIELGTIGSRLALADVYDGIRDSSL
ncbi:MAG: Uma2 family endonuclease [Acidobacteriota bacterium]